MLLFILGLLALRNGDAFRSSGYFLSKPVCKRNENTRLEASTDKVSRSSISPSVVLGLLATVSVIMGSPLSSSVNAREEIISSTTSLKGTLKDTLRAYSSSTGSATSTSPPIESTEPVVSSSLPAVSSTVSPPSLPQIEVPKIDLLSTLSVPQVTLPSIPSVSSLPTVQLPSISDIESALTVPKVEVPNLPPTLLRDSTILTDFYKSVFTDWRTPLVVAVIVVLADLFEDTKRLRSDVGTKDDKINELVKSLRDLEAMNEDNLKRLHGMEADSKSLCEQVHQLTSDLSEKYALIESMNQTVSQVDISTGLIGTEVKEDLSKALQTIHRLESENTELNNYKSSVKDSVDSVSLMREREAATTEAVKIFLLDEGYIGQGVANMVLAGTIPSIIKECTGKLDNTPAVISRKENILKGDVKASKEVSTLERKLEQSKKLIEKLHDQLAAANLSKVKAEAVGKDSTAAVSATSAQLQDEISVLQKEMKEIKRVHDKEIKERDKRLKTLSDELEKASAAASASNEANETGKRVNDLEIYVAQLKTENDELKNRMMASEDRLLDLTTDMQSKIDSAKEMAKMLNGQLLSKAAEFEERESLMQQELGRLKGAVGSVSNVVAEVTDAPAKVDKKIKVSKKASVAVVDKPSSSSPSSPALVKFMDELRVLKPYVLRKKSKKEIEDICIALELKGKAGEILDIGSMSKLEMLELLELQLYAKQ